MAGLQRLVKSGIRLYNYRSHGVISPINRLGAPVNFHRSLCSSSVKWTDKPDTLARSAALRAEGFPVIESQVLAEFVKELPEAKFNSLLKDIRRLKSFEKESEELRKLNNTKVTEAPKVIAKDEIACVLGLASLVICALGALILMASQLPVV